MKSKRILYFLIPIFLVSLIYSYLQTPRQERVSSGDDKVKQRTAAKTKEKNNKVSASKGEGFPRLRTDLLERKEQSYPGVKRDLFSAFSIMQSEEESISLPEEEVIVVQPVVVPVTPPPPVPPSTLEIARQELSRYKVVGFFKKGERQTVFLSTSDEILLVRQGDYLGRDKKYFVVNVTDETMELRKNGAADFLIKLTDQSSLSSISLQGKTNSKNDTLSSPRGLQSEPSELRSQGTEEPEITLPDSSEFLSLPDEELQTEDQFQPDEDTNETSN